jgi:hypothetical protein
VGLLPLARASVELAEAEVESLWRQPWTARWAPASVRPSGLVARHLTGMRGSAAESLAVGSEERLGFDSVTVKSGFVTKSPSLGPRP